MELVLRILASLLAPIAMLINTLLNWFLPRQEPTYPPIRDPLLLKSVGELVLELRAKKLSSVELVRAYIERIKDVNVTLNCVVEERFEEALKEAEHADQLIAKATPDQLAVLFARYPLLGVPFTVKESCGLKGLSYCVGNIHRVNEKCPENGETVELLRSSGCIPLLVSANPEFCLSFETNSHTHGRCLNPYDLRRTTAGSSGGEAALNGAGASTFGVASDIAGSIRLPAMYCGVFGHKPTGGLVSVKGHLPYSSTDPQFAQFLQLGPISRFARDLPILVQIMAGKNADKLKFNEGIKTKDIKVFYSYGFSGLNGLLHPWISFDIKLGIVRAIKCFEKGGLTTKEVNVKGFANSVEISLSAITTLKGIPSIISQSSRVRPTTKVLIKELFLSFFGHSLYTKEALFMELMHNLNGLIPHKNGDKWKTELESLRQELLDLLGKDGVLFFPTFHTSAVAFHTSLFNVVSIDMLTIFNALGFPSTHVPMGLDRRGMPIGFQIIAAPYQDKLCLQLAAELEGAFGGWVPPLKHDIDTA